MANDRLLMMGTSRMRTGNEEVAYMPRIIKHYETRRETRGRPLRICTKFDASNLCLRVSRAKTEGGTAPFGADKRRTTAVKMGFVKIETMLLSSIDHRVLVMAKEVIECFRLELVQRRTAT